MNILQCENVTKTYKMGQTTVTALDGVDLAVEKGEFVAGGGSVRLRKVHASAPAGRCGPPYLRNDKNRRYGYFHLVGKTAFSFQEA